MRLRSIHIICFALAICFYSYSQEPFFMTGLLPDDGTYDRLERKNELLTRDYTVLPRAYSLYKYCPVVKSQSQYGTCTSWATAYAARTIAEAVKYGWTDKAKITNEAFSPLFVYALIKDPYAYDSDCQEGTSIHKALQVMKERGVPKFSSFSVLCANHISDELMQKAKPFRIDDYFTLFSITCVDASEKIRKVKKALSEDCPVVIAMHIPYSFFYAEHTWNGQDVDPAKHGYHAMCVIGYDDAMQGGAFQIMNSWGTDWGENGFVWVKYNEFAKYVDQAYEIYVNKETPKPYNNEDEKPIRLAGQITLQLSTGETMNGTLQPTERINRYILTDSYISGTRYRLYISNNEPAYVYVLGSDLTGNIGKVFPPNDKISAALTYKSNNIAIPDERFYIEMDNTQGTDYMCVLYSKYALDIYAIIAQMQSLNGSFYKKLQSALGNKMIDTSEIYCAKNKITFQTQSSRSVVPIIVEIPHK